jgi:hypothetical protein
MDWGIWIFFHPSVRAFFSGRIYTKSIPDDMLTHVCFSVIKIFPSECFLMSARGLALKREKICTFFFCYIPSRLVCALILVVHSNFQRSCVRRRTHHILKISGAECADSRAHNTPNLLYMYVFERLMARLRRRLAGAAAIYF